MLPFIQKSLPLSKILRITPVTEDKSIAGDKDATELQALPTSTEIDVDLHEPLLESQAAAQLPNVPVINFDMHSHDIVCNTIKILTVL